MCLALDIPLIAISGLVAYGRYLYSIKAEEVTDVFILMDARRDNFFYAHIKNKHSMKESVFANRVDIETVIQCCLRPWVFYTDKSEEIKLTAKELKQGVIEKWKTQDFESLASFEPKYIVNNYISKK